VQAGREILQGGPRRRDAGVELARAHRLQERLGERPPDPHRLTHGLHLRPELLVGAGELLEGEPGELDDDVVERRLEAGRRRPGQVVRDLVERVADGELGRHLGDRVSGRLARERRGARHPRVHLDDAQLAGLPLARELDVGAARFDTHRADSSCGGVAKLLVVLVRQRHLRCDGHRVTGVDAHWVEVLDRADDDHVVALVAHHLELELVPADEGLLDEHLVDRALVETDLEHAPELLGRCRDSAAVTAERERRAQDDRESEPARQIAQRGCDDRGGNGQPDASHRLAEEAPIFGAVNGVEARADELDAELRQDTVFRQRAREVERRLAAERRQERIGTLAR
jgi:hypothetical protein